MLLPKGEAIYKDLKTEYVKLEKLIKDLSNETFTGYVKLDTTDFTGILFFDRGKLIGAVTEPESPTPMLEIMKMSSKPGVINVYTLSPEHINILASAITGTKVIEKIPFEIVDFVKLMERLSRERFSGIVDIEDPQEESALVIYFFDGDPVDFMYEDIDITLTGDKVLDQIDSLKDSPTALLTVYESNIGLTRIDPETIKHDIIDFYQQICKFLIKKLGERTFSKLFRKNCLDNVDEYPFLDPFDPGIYIEKGTSHLVIQDDVPITAASRALNKVFSNIIESLSSKDKKKLKEKINNLLSEKPELSEIVRLYIGD